MKFDVRCMQETIRRNIACARGVEMHHVSQCECERNAIIITHKSAIVINTPNNTGYCPCGLPSHKGECRDAAREAQGLEHIKWRP